MFFLHIWNWVEFKCKTQFIWTINITYAITITSKHIVNRNKYSNAINNKYLSSPVSGKTEMNPIERSSMEMERLHGCGKHASRMKTKASSSDVKLYQRRFPVTRTSLAHLRKSWAPVRENGRRVTLERSVSMFSLLWLVELWLWRSIILYMINISLCPSIILYS